MWVTGASPRENSRSQSRAHASEASRAAFPSSPTSGVVSVECASLSPPPPLQHQSRLEAIVPVTAGGGRGEGLEGVPRDPP